MMPTSKWIAARMLIPLLSVALIAGGCGSKDQAAPSLMEHTDPTPPIPPDKVETDVILTPSAPPAGDWTNATLTFRLVDIRPLRGEARGSLVIQLVREAGQWLADEHAVGADYNQRSDDTITLERAELIGRRLTARLKVTIGTDRPHPNPRSIPGFPNPPDEFTIDLEADIDPNAQLPYQPNPTPFLPPWRQDIPLYGGARLSGTYTARVGNIRTEGDVTGGVSPRPVEGTSGVTGNMTIAPADGEGVDLTARLSPTRVAGPQSAYLIHPFAGPQDWSDHKGLAVTIATDTRRDDTAVAVAVTEADGSWYSSVGAAKLLPGEHTYYLPFGDFRRGGDDEDYHLDRSSVGGVCVGVDSPLGVGTVRFTLRKVELADWPDNVAAETDRTHSIRLSADPLTVRSFNGQTRVPKGLFGFHDVHHSRPRRPEGKPSPTEYMQRINPGYLRPLDHVGFSGPKLTDEQIAQRVARRLANSDEPNTPFYRRAKAGNAVDKVVWCHTVDLFARPAWMDQPMGQTLAGVRAFYRNLASRAWVPGDEHNLLRRLEVWNEPFMWGRHINMGSMTPAGKTDWSDPTQHGYIPAELGARVYSDIFAAAVEGAKSANEHVTLGGPCSPSFNGDYYANWTNYVARYVEACGESIDFLTEHHYGGLPASYAASYEAAKAWCDLRVGRRIPIYNTECNDLGGNPTPPANRALYNLADIITCINECPDVLKGRAVHALWSGYLRNSGTEDAFTLAGPVRGRVLMLDSQPEVDLPTCAVLGDDDAIRILVVNSGHRTRSIRHVPPDRYRLTGQVHLAVTDGQTRLDRLSGQQLETGKVTITHELAPREALLWTLTPADSAELDEPAVQQLEQSFCDVLFADVPADGSVKAAVQWSTGPPADNQPAEEARETIESLPPAWLRVVTRGCDRGEAVAVIGGTTIPLPYSSANSACEVVQQVPLDPRLLTPETTVTFRCAHPESSNGFHVICASILRTVE